MKDRFNPQQLEAQRTAHPELSAELTARIYTAQLIGQEHCLALQNSASCSVKTSVKDITGEDLEILMVTGRGQDLSTIGAEGFSRLRLTALQKLHVLKELADEALANQLLTNRLDAGSPPAPVEGLLHAFIAHQYVDCTPADAILALTHQKEGEKIVRKVLGPAVAVIPYRKPGFALAKSAAAALEQNPRAEALVCMQYGILTFGPDAQTAYRRMIHYISLAEDYIAEKSAPLETKDIAVERIQIEPELFANLATTIRGACSFVNDTGKRRRFYLDIRTSAEIKAASLSPLAAEICRSGVLTPRHARSTKNAYVYLEHLPAEDKLQEAVTQAVARFRENYDACFERYSKARAVATDKPDNTPRVFLVGGIGLICLGFTRSSARTAGDIAARTLLAKQKSYALGGCQALPETHVIEMECLNAAPKPQKDRPGDLAGQVALVTGAAGAIGFGIADRLLQQQAVIVLADIDAARLKTAARPLVERYGAQQVEQLTFDVTDFAAVQKAVQEICLRLGGIDIIVPNAGIAHVATIEKLEPAAFSRVVNVNLFGVFNVIKAAVPVFKRQGTGGNVVLISSKNVFDPGAAFGAYSASKAAAHQICRIAALELAPLGVRVNMINPDAVFGDQSVPSKLWDTIGPERMKARGLDPEGLKEYYRKRNLLKTSVLAEHVGNAVVFFASEKTPTTGATLPVDGGVPAAFPR